MEDDVFEDPAGFENVLAPRQHREVGVDKLSRVQKFAEEFGVRVFTIRG